MNSDKHLHIVCSDVPFPVNYGELFDVFYKLKSLHRAGIRIHLHCFDNGRGPQDELNKYTEEVFYYPQQQGHKGFSFKLPYIIGSRIDSTLEARLLQDEFPILIEGLHASHFAHDPRFSKRRIFLREQHIEYRTFDQYRRFTLHPFRRFYYGHESNLLKEYERKTVSAIPVSCVTDADKRILQETLHAREVIRIPLFLPFQKVMSSEGVGSYCLFHGNLSLPENERAAFYLLNQVFNDLEVPFVITGKNPSRRLLNAAKKSKFHCLVDNPSEADMQDMVAKAQINILPSFQQNGVKSKLLNALFNGRHCVVNEPTVQGTGLESATHIASNPDAFKRIVAQLYHMPFAPEEIELRRQLLEHEYNNERNTTRLIQWLW